MCSASYHLELVFIANFMKTPKVSVGPKMISTVTKYVKYDALWIVKVHFCICRYCIMEYKMRSKPKYICKYFRINTMTMQIQNKYSRPCKH